MNLALRVEIETKRKQLFEVYDRNDEVATSEEVLRASEELDKLIVQYLMEREAEKKIAAEQVLKAE